MLNDILNAVCIVFMAYGIIVLRKWHIVANKMNQVCDEYFEGDQE